MTTHTPESAENRIDPSFHHPALFYTTEEDYLRGVGAFVRTEAAGGHPVLVAVPGPRLQLLREAVGTGDEDVTFVDMRQAGRNPGRILSMLQSFADRYPDRRPSIVGEPIWVGRTAAEVREATRHEALINLAFDGRPVTILCPYDTALPERVLAEAHRTHPVVGAPDGYAHSPRYADPHTVCRDCDRPLEEPADPLVLHFTEQDLAEVRDTAGHWAQKAGLSSNRHTDWLLAVNEATGNSVRHGGGQGTLRLWRTADTLIAEVRDRGRLTDALVGRRRPDPLSPFGGRGVWMMHQLCDLVEMRTPPSGLIVRMHLALD
ncbi:anti-sigma factor RsbA family regulatory protein [Streptomyces pilosus]|uniref:Anti-sigma regulatory factor n=1 Tax=Streptomyces pilosus TaxID=28893 RepID=A0A918BJM1_9ACTN|nr:anti-sigma factor RsbA family regulatory protein [Streptomyces pilosus]GGQ70680.1 anti-sigma regulatory factor [Streptomyces pilosus]GGV70137.1 anti-sigma regulatory factor [Streptomyces pilosus]